MGDQKKRAKSNNSDGNKRATRKDELDAKLAIRLALIDRVTNLLRVSCVCGSACFVAYMLYRSIDAMAGKSTDFKSVIDWAMKMGVSQGLGLALIAILGAWGYTNHRARKKMAQQAGPRLRKLEEKADPDRASSGLTSTVTSPP